MSTIDLTKKGVANSENRGFIDKNKNLHCDRSWFDMEPPVNYNCVKCTPMTLHCGGGPMTCSQKAG